MRWNKVYKPRGLNHPRQIERRNEMEQSTYTCPPTPPGLRAINTESQECVAVTQSVERNPPSEEVPGSISVLTVSFLTGWPVSG